MLDPLSRRWLAEALVLHRRMTPNPPPVIGIIEPKRRPQVAVEPKLLDKREAAAKGPDGDTPLRLEDAVRLGFPPGSGVTVSTLRNEITKGTLPRREFGGKLWLTLNDIHQAMTARTAICAPVLVAPRRVRGSSLKRPADPAASGAGSSTTATPGDAAGSRRDAMALIASRLKASAATPTTSSLRTSGKSHGPSKVVPIK